MGVYRSNRRASRTTRRVPSIERRARFFGLLVLLIAVVGSSIIHAAEGENVTITVGRSTVLDTGHPIARVSLTSADIADALVTSTSELLINGKTPGTISMFVWDRAGAIRRYEVVVQRDITQLADRLATLFPGEAITAHLSGKSIVLSGTVSTKDIAEKAASVAAGYVDKKDDVVPMMQIQNTRSTQVLLRVRFAEVSRSALTELGAGFFTSPTGVKQTLGRVTTQQFPSVGFDELKYEKPVGGFGKDITSNSGKFTFSDFLNLFLFSEKYDLGMMIRALQTRGLFQSLAEPNLVAESGKEASFLAGGEIPVPIAQPSGGAVAVTVQWKEFGIRLNFTPVVNGNRVHLKVKPEVSALDFNNAIVLQGFRIPALTTRRTETEIEIENGQTFAIAGLLNNTMNSAMQKIPGIGDIPVLGLLFKSKAAQKNQTELVVMITPEIVPNGSSGVTSTLPRLVEPFMPPPPRTIDPPPPAFRPAGSGADQAAAAPGVAMPAPASAVPMPAAAPPTLTTQEGQVLLRQHAQETAKPDAKELAADAKRQAKVAEEERRRSEQVRKEADEQTKRDAEAAREQAKRDEQAAREQAKRNEQAAREQLRRDMEAAKQQAEIDKAAKEAAAKRAAEQAKKQSEIDKREQKLLDDAQARLKAAEAAYQAELAKRNSSSRHQ